MLAPLSEPRRLQLLIASKARVGELPQGQRDRHLVARAAGDGLGELHVADAGREVGVGDGALAADRGDEVGLDLPAALEGRRGSAAADRRVVRAAAAADLVAEAGRRSSVPSLP